LKVIDHLNCLDPQIHSQLKIEIKNKNYNVSFKGQDCGFLFFFFLCLPSICQTHKKDQETFALHFRFSNGHFISGQLRSFKNSRVSPNILFKNKNLSSKDANDFCQRTLS
jgi:hypothetical protein